MSKKMGRPLKTAYPKTERFTLRISKPELDLLTKCAETLGVSRSDVIVKSIELLSMKLNRDVSNNWR